MHPSSLGCLTPRELFRGLFGGGVGGGGGMVSRVGTFSRSNRIQSNPGLRTPH